MIWDMFKAYIHSILIAFKASREKKQSLTKNELMDTMYCLEGKNKQVSEARTSEIQSLYQQVKLLDACSIAQETMYAKQLMYEYRDKAVKQLARLVSEHPVNCKVSPMLMVNGDMKGCK